MLTHTKRLVRNNNPLSGRIGSGCSENNLALEHGHDSVRRRLAGEDSIPVGPHLRQIDDHGSGGIGSRGTGHPHGFIRAGVTSGGIGGRVWRACLVTAPAIIRAAIACTVIACTGGVIRSAIRGLGLSHHNAGCPPSACGATVCCSPSSSRTTASAITAIAAPAPTRM